MQKIHRIAATATVLSAVTAGAFGVAGAVAQATPEVGPLQPVEAEEAAATVQSSHVQLASVEGTFAFTQAEVDDARAIERTFRSSSAVLCGADQASFDAASASYDGTIWVLGDVENPLAVDVASRAQSHGVSIVMGCACLGNPSDGRASANAEVAGFSLRELIVESLPDASVNTVVVTSADGYEVALPLFYVMQHPCVIVTEVNGEPSSQVMHAQNQLWIGSVNARSFVRDIVEIRVEHRDVVPDAPNLVRAESTPNATLLAGTSE